MLLDEPLSNLDANLREEMRFEIKELQRKTGVTIFYVTHDQEIALAISDRVAVMDREAGPADRSLRMRSMKIRQIVLSSDSWVFRILSLWNRRNKQFMCKGSDPGWRALASGRGRGEQGLLQAAGPRS